MTRTYCDKCGTQLNANHRGENEPDGLSAIVEKGEYLAPKTRVAVIGINVTPEHGAHVCKYCVLDAIAELDDRPKQASVELPITPAKIFQPHRVPDTAVVSTLAPAEPHESYPVS